MNLSAVQAVHRRCLEGAQGTQTSPLPASGRVSFLSEYNSSRTDQYRGPGSYAPLKTY